MLTKRLLVIIILTVFTFSLISCGKNTAQDSDKDISNPRITIQNQDVELNYNGEILASGCYSKMKLSDEVQAKYPKLKPVIDRFNNDWKKDFDENIPTDSLTAGDLKMMAEEASGIQSGELYYDIAASVPRFDEHLFIVKYDLSYDMGGPHGYNFTYASTYNPNSGEIVKLSDTVKNKAKLAEIIARKIYKIDPEFEYSDYSNCITGQPYKSSDLDQAKELFKEMISDDEITWILNDKGLNIVFSEYDLAPHGNGGEFDFTIPYDELEKIIKPEYIMTNSQDMDKIVKTEELPVKRFTK